ncbi:hypothetical protein CLHOM_21880 [Clostridium homopropionicum DSM 5847]|uniref:DUF218 domain-containing protein n=1 Tax=Clostridium homopropionicum DSM 5847 TaxID=1121318 RepID=A0A0L6Z8U4_9CLOT|nr:YdcF family protein [Clostridium homopropionicum]KOA19397.1 hypothetical protein CLHOM_21880 [Clostridium homopropionicum DSM 5847]SFG68533.1 Uncharacterized SAM-binding protein YcdF, DUF218 family [Clostridium homopropionicum]
MRNIKSKVYISLSILCILYYIILIGFGGIISFSLFWALAGAVFLFLSIVERGSITFSWKMFKRLKPAFYLGITIVITSFLIIESLIIYYGSDKGFKKSDYLLILGAGLRGETMSLTLTQRMNKALEYLREHPDTKIIVSGGKGTGESITEAEAMKRFLIQNGVEEKYIIKEEKSTNTAENFQYSRDIIRKIDTREAIKITVVTTNFHMFRAKQLAAQVGLKDIYTVPSDLHFILIPNYYVREYLAVIKSYIFDRVN